MIQVDPAASNIEETLDRSGSGSMGDRTMLRTRAALCTRSPELPRASNSLARPANRKLGTFGRRESASEASPVVLPWQHSSRSHEARPISPGAPPLAGGPDRPPSLVVPLVPSRSDRRLPSLCSLKVSTLRPPSAASGACRLPAFLRCHAFTARIHIAMTTSLRGDHLRD
jgi:hypothetical protein